MTSVITAELLAFLSIPLAATLMSRGVGYADWLPWQARGVALCRCPALADALPYADALPCCRARRARAGLTRA